MPALLLWELIFYYHDNFFKMLEKHQQEKKFAREFDKICTNVSRLINHKKKKQGCKVYLLNQKFDII